MVDVNASAQNSGDAERDRIARDIAGRLFQRGVDVRDDDSDDDITSIEDEVDKEIAAAIHRFEALGAAQPLTMFDHVYAERHPLIEEERAQFAAYLDTFEITITGKGSHGAMPETGIDSVVVAAQLVGALQTVVSRRTRATDSAVVSVTQIHGGDTWNVIPETVVLRGTVRTLDATVQQNTQAAMQQICDGVGLTHGATITLDYRKGYPGVVNTPAETAAAVTAAASLVGDASVHTDIPPAMGSEDFAFMLLERPGAYIAIGAGEGPNDPPVHNPYYDFNDNILPLGAAYWVALVQQQLPAA